MYRAATRTRLSSEISLIVWFRGVLYSYHDKINKMMRAFNQVFTHPLIWQWIPFMITNVHNYNDVGMILSLGEGTRAARKKTFFFRNDINSFNLDSYFTVLATSGIAYDLKLWAPTAEFPEDIEQTNQYIDEVYCYIQYFLLPYLLVYSHPCQGYAGALQVSWPVSGVSRNCMSYWAVDSAFPRVRYKGLSASASTEVFTHPYKWTS